MKTRVRASTGSLLRGLLIVGVVGFGGGSALIPVIQRELVDRRGLLEEEQYVRHTVVANLTPGALPVKLAASAGMVVSGWRIAVFAPLAVALPGVLGTVSLLALSDALGPWAVRSISFASVGISVFIVVLLLGYIANVHARAGDRRWRYALITGLVAALTGADVLTRLVGNLVGAELSASWFPRVGVVEVILASLAVIVVASMVVSSRGARQPRRSNHSGLALKAEVLGPALRAAAACGFLAVAGVVTFLLVGGGAGLETGLMVALSSVTSFGGGEAYIAVADGYFVQNALVDRQDFYTRLVPIANALPGPILVKVAAGVGYMLGGDATSSLLLAGAATAATVGACCGLSLFVHGAYESMRDHPITVAVGRYILPVICGLLVSVSAQMLGVAAEVGRDAGVSTTQLLLASLGAVVVMAWLHIRRIVPDLIMLATAGTVSLLGLWVAAG